MGVHFTRLDFLGDTFRAWKMIKRTMSPEDPSRASTTPNPSGPSTSGSSPDGETPKTSRRRVHPSVNDQGLQELQGNVSYNRVQPVSPVLWEGSCWRSIQSSAACCLHGAPVWPTGQMSDR
ncbi:hypothetical protein J4Q44_G00377730 [Coregonus suidteri]|uniref:Uncharacterized protein n=1 Tax=Coregonus suidteri TaxID=861788 RepID=A0AAN8KJS1_9TELE